jgi:hypothetical protein
MSLINDDTYGDSAIKLKTLEKEYDILLKQYLEAKKNYVEALQSDAKGDSSYIIKENTGIRGNVFKTIQDVSSIEDCKALCIENKCDGAEYQINQKTCKLNHANLGISISENPNYSSIVKNHINYLGIMGNIIAKLLIVNAQMLETAENVDPTYQQDIEAKKIRADELFKNYKGLINERDLVNQQMDEYSMLSQKYSDENINAGRQYGLVSAWGFLVFLIFVFALREIFQIPISFFPIFIGAIVFFLGLNLGVPTGFLIWLGVIALLIFLYFMSVNINIG